MNSGAFFKVFSIIGIIFAILMILFDLILGIDFNIIKYLFLGLIVGLVAAIGIAPTMDAND